MTSASELLAPSLTVNVYEPLPVPVGVSPTVQTPTEQEQEVVSERPTKFETEQDVAVNDSLYSKVINCS